MDQVLAGVQCALEGRYTVECEFSRGGMATVFLAGDLSMPGVSGSDSPKAVKVHTKGQL